MPPTPRPTTGPTPLSAALILCAMTAVMLTLAFPPFYVWPLAFFAIVPFALCVVHRPLKVRWLALYYLLGMAYFSPNLYWLWPVTRWGTFALAGFISLYFVLFAFGLHRLVVDLRVPATFALPLVWTSVEFARATFLEGGFPWFLVGNVYAPNGSILGGLSTLFLQSADLFGVWGLTFLAMTVNGFVLDLLRLPLVRGLGLRLNPQMWRLAIYTGALLVLSLGYGYFRLWQYPKVTTEGPTIAVVQENIPQRLKDDPSRFPGYFRSHLELTKQAIDKYSPALVAWPETMVPYAFNEEWLSVPPRYLSDYGQVQQASGDLAYKELRGLSDAKGAALLVGTNAYRPDKEGNILGANTAALIMPGRGEVKRYDKRHLVPFGEYIPFAAKGTWLRRFLQNLTPVGQDYSLEPGKEWTRFELPAVDGGKPLHFSTPICFEDVMPRPSREMARLLPDGTKRVDLLLNISNDGWFYVAELDQHLQASQLRAVENRVPMARSVNTGNSGFIDSCGRIVELIGPRKVGVSGWQVRLDSRTTLYARIGDLLPIGCGIVSALLVAWTFVRPRRGKKA